MGFLIFGLVALYFAIRLLLTLAFVAAPALVLASTAISSTGRDDFPDPDELVDPNLENLLKQIDDVLAVLSEEVTNFYRTGASNGLSLTSKSNGTRFDKRKSLGRALNAALDDAASKIFEYQSLRITYEERRQALKRKYYNQVKKWARPKAANVSNWVGAIGLCLALFASLTTGIGDLASNVVVANPYNAKPGLIAGFIVGALGYGIAYFVTMRTKMAESNYSAKYEERAAFLAKLDADARETVNEEATEWDVGGQAEPAEDWHTVLNIGVDATVDQIKAAYREAMKQYHPDNFEGRGQKIKDLANQETRRINAAFEAARDARQF
ncbi:J domain-containing protein [Bradyrhizobium sp. AZCC 1721]|uniref:J domain-containing protein n=1 Tax=Bradyrhizobium sp. AZCC 1721 TaxID=3117016 RepID=UPI002FF2441E